MWHRYQFCSVILFTFGLGVLVGHVIPSSFLCALLVISVFILGLMTARRRR